MTDAQRKEQVAGMSKTIFSYCLSRTSSYTEAEDLSQEILLECIKSIVNLRDEKAFYAFVWRTADNILKKFYARKKRILECELDENLSDDPYREIEERAQTDMQLGLINRELAFLRSSYRHVMIEHYINQRSVKDIAQILSISESMVKYLLFQSRKRIKEDITMEKIYGQYSYNPVKLAVRYWGDQNKYWNILSKISQNIIMSCYFDKQTEEQISIQTGIPTAYLEEEIKKLIEADIITESNGFYQSNILVLTKDELSEIAKANEPVTRKIADFVRDFTDKSMDVVRKIGFYGSDMSANSLKWLIISKLLKTAYINILHSRHPLDFPVDVYGIPGFRWLCEESPNDDGYALGMAQRFTRLGYIDFWDVFSINGEIMHTKVSDASANMLISLSTSQPETESEKLICSELINANLAVATPDGIKPNCPCFTTEQMHTFVYDIIAPAAEKICDMAEDNLKVIIEKVVENAPDRLKDYASKMAQLEQFEEVEDIMRILCESGWLLPYKSGIHPTSVITLE